MSTSSPTSVPYTYQQAPLITDPNVIKANMISYLTAYMPAGWRLAPGSQLDLVLEAVAIQAGQQADVAQQKLDSDFRYFGSLVNLPPINAVPATATATFTVQDNTGWVVTAGTSIGLVDPTGTLQGFDLSADLVIAPGVTTGAGAVVAEQPGIIGNNLSGSAQLIQADSWVTGATIATSGGGIDAELDADFLNRLTETLGLLTPVPVLGTNYAVLARSIAGVYRAAGVNLLKPGPPYDSAPEATGVDKNVTVAVTDINGLTVGPTIRGNAQTYLSSLREDNFQIWVVDAQYNEIDVTQALSSWPGWDPTDVQTRVIAAITQVVSPATAQTDPSGNAARWANDPWVRVGDIYQAVKTQPGVRNLGNPQLGIHGGALGTVDVQLGVGSAIPALPTPGTISVTVTPTTL